MFGIAYVSIGSYFGWDIGQVWSGPHHRYGRGEQFRSFNFWLGREG